MSAALERDVGADVAGQVSDRGGAANKKDEGEGDNIKGGVVYFIFFDVPFALDRYNRLGAHTLSERRSSRFACSGLQGSTTWSPRK